MSPLSHFTLPLPFPKEMKKKISYRRQDANSEHILYLSVRQSRLDGGIMFPTCSFVRPSVRSFVCYQLVNAILRKGINRFQCKLA